ncbi:hypothetical protein [Brachyspira sp.]|uniref:hypothetical protein n=1 Tax=Brachyspira sp. TaxID=1977261 RepID=UPI00262460E1|nr:hypothetical protein [Brachyspira sp.]
MINFEFNIVYILEIVSALLYEPYYSTLIVRTNIKLIEMIYKNKLLKINFVRMISIKVNNVILKIKALKEENYSQS